MPKVRRVELPQWTTVDAQLHKAAVDLLPAEFAEDPLVKWVTEYDGLIRQVHESNDFSESVMEASVICHLSTSLLRTRMPLYFAAIFHIGRLRQVAKQVLETVSHAQETEEIEKWASCLSERLPGSSRRRTALATLKRLSHASKMYYRRQLGLADKWWAQWRLEVEPLSQGVEALQRAWEKNKDRGAGGHLLRAALKIWSVASFPSELITSMTTEGVRFKSAATGLNGELALTGNSSLTGLLLIGASAGGLSWDSHEFRELQHWFYETERQRRLAPQVHVVLEMLKKKYGEKNPFAEFGPNQKAATLVLRGLVKENMLPNGDPSPWLHAWKQTLESMGWWIPRPALPKPTVQFTQLKSAVRLADSAIKENITKEMRPTETWNDFVQRLFEQWVKTITEMAGAANRKAGETTVIWRLQDLVAFTDAVVLKLNEIGYKLKTPDPTRLKRLLDETSYGKSGYGSDDW